jgi:hypothetical protein
MLNDGLLSDVKKMAKTMLIPSCGKFVDLILCQVLCSVLLSDYLQNIINVYFLLILSDGNVSSH